MKNLKFVLAIAGISLATICSVQDANARKKGIDDSQVRCGSDSKLCGVSIGGCVLTGTPYTI